VTAGRPGAGATGEVAYLLGVVATQTLIVVVVPHPWGGLLPLAGLAAALFAGVTARSIRRTLRGMLLITLPVLLIRLLTVPSLDTAIDWADYAGRLVAAALIATAYLAARGVRGVQRALCPRSGQTRTGRGGYPPVGSLSVAGDNPPDDGKPRRRPNPAPAGSRLIPDNDGGCRHQGHPPLGKYRSPPPG